MTDTPADRNRRALNDVATRRDWLIGATKAADRARTDLYRAVHAATLAGVPTMAIADAAGWKTKKAVYDACRAVDGDRR